MNNKITNSSSGNIYSLEGSSDVGESFNILDENVGLIKNVHTLANVILEQQKALDKINKNINDIELENVSKQKELSKTLKDLEDKQIKLSKELEKTRKSSVATIGIFTFLFTFIGANINIFTKMQYLYQAIWFMILMTICTLIIIFTFLIYLGMDKMENLSNILTWKLPLLLLIMLVAFLGLTIWFELTIERVPTLLKNNNTIEQFKSEKTYNQDYIDNNIEVIIPIQKKEVEKKNHKL
jgi:hypothetical protein